MITGDWNAARVGRTLSSPRLEQEHLSCDFIFPVIDSHPYTDAGMLMCASTNIHLETRAAIMAKKKTSKKKPAKKTVRKKSVKKPTAKAATKHKAEKPKPLLLRKVTFDVKGIFKTLGKGVVDYLSGNASGLAKDVVDLVGGVSLEKKSPEELAFQLLQTSLANAVRDLVNQSAESLFDFRTSIEVDKKLESTLDRICTQYDVEVDRDFFARPEEMAILAPMRNALRAWFEHAGMHRSQAEAFAGRLNSYYVYALREEWRGRANVYSPLAAAIDTPFDEAAERTNRWESYAAWLDRVLDEPMFEESFGLREVYVPIRCYYERNVNVHDKAPFHVYPVADLLETMRAWVEAPEAKEALRIITGGPGSGKSSFAKTFAAEVANSSEFRNALRIVYVPLQRFDVKSSLADSLESFCAESSTNLPSGLLNEETAPPRLLLIFDGLDELAKQGAVAERAAQDFVSYVQTVLSRRNEKGECRLQILLIGRPLAVETHKSQLRDQYHCYHVLPYFLTDKNRPAVDLLDSQKLLEGANGDQRDLWWWKFGTVKGLEFESLPETLKRPDIDPITSEPLLNYLIALSFQRGRINFSGEFNLNQVYQDLLQGVFERKHDQGPLAPVRKIEFDDFTLLLEDVAVAAWHNAGRTATVAEIRKRCDATTLEQLDANAKSGVLKLLVAFFFHESSELRGEAAYEFTHKSFGEYLTARRLLRHLEDMHEEFVRHQNNARKGWSAVRCLEEWADIAGWAKLDRDLLTFVRNEIALRESRAEWRQTVHTLFHELLDGGLPHEAMRTDPERASVEEIVQYATNAESSLLSIGCLAFAIDDAHFEIKIPEGEAQKDQFRNWFIRLAEPGENLVIPKIHLSPATNLCLLNLYEANLEGANLDGVILNGAILEGARLDGANLYNAFLAGTNLKEAKLENAHLCKANLEGANLHNAMLARTNLKGANLENSNFLEANLERANLSYANVRGAKLGGANIHSANLDMVILVGTNLVGANLDEANLDEANLRGANLGEAKMHKANLSGANLGEVNLVRANLGGADFNGANLVRANLVGADLDGAVLDGANLDGAAFGNPLKIENIRLKSTMNVEHATFDSAESRERFLNAWRAQNSPDDTQVPPDEAE